MRPHGHPQCPGSLDDGCDIATGSPTTPRTSTKVSLRIVTMQSQGIITRDNVSVDISAVAYFRVVDPVKSVIAIENVDAAINQIAQTTLRKVVGQHTLTTRFPKPTSSTPTSRRSSMWRPSSGAWK